METRILSGFGRRRRALKIVNCFIFMRYNILHLSRENDGVRKLIFGLLRYQLIGCPLKIKFGIVSCKILKNGSL